MCPSPSLHPTTGQKPGYNPNQTYANTHRPMPPWDSNRCPSADLKPNPADSTPGLLLEPNSPTSTLNLTLTPKAHFRSPTQGQI